MPATIATRPAGSADETWSGTAPGIGGAAAVKVWSGTSARRLWLRPTLAGQRR
jgi:hypothetical protein